MNSLYTLAKRPKGNAKATQSKADQSADSITITGLQKLFRRRGGSLVSAVDNMSLSVPSGQMLVLLGPSGCGKTTLLRCIGGLESPDAGEIIVNGEVMYSSSQKTNRPPNTRNISMMFQSYALWPHMTVAANVMYPLKGRGYTRDKAREKVHNILTSMGVGHLADQYPGRLSGGQQQRVALARSLVTDPSVILFDEPLSNVDAKVREELRVELMTMQKSLGFTGVYVTHDQVEALQLADQLAVLGAGKIIQIDAPKTVYSRPATAMVARFVGTLNELPGTLESVDGDGNGVVRTALGVLQGCDYNAGLQAKDVGREVLAGVRAEALHLTTDASAVPNGSNVCRGTLVAEGFAGAYVVHVFKTKDIMLDVHSPASGRPMMQFGDDTEVILHFAPKDTYLFASDK